MRKGGKPTHPTSQDTMIIPMNVIPVIFTSQHRWIDDKNIIIAKAAIVQALSRVSLVSIYRCNINLTGWERERLSVSNAPVFVSLIPGWTNFALVICELPRCLGARNRRGRKTVSVWVLEWLKWMYFDASSGWFLWNNTLRQRQYTSIAFYIWLCTVIDNAYCLLMPRLLSGSEPAGHGYRFRVPRFYSGIWSYCPSNIEMMRLSAS